MPLTGYFQTIRKHSWFFLFSVAVSGGIFTYLLTTVSPAEILNAIKGLTPRWIILFLLFSFGQTLFRTWRYNLLLSTAGYRPDSLALFLITLVRGFFSDLLPARLGTLIYIFLVQTRLGIPFGPAASSFAYSFLFDIISLAFLIILAVLWQSSGVFSPAALFGGAAGIGLAGIAILLALPYILRMMATVSTKIPMASQIFRQRLHNALQEAGDTMAAAREQGVFWRVLALSLGVRSCKYLSLYVLLLALVLPMGFTRESFPLAKVFLGLCSAELAASLPVSGIAGFGAYEGAWALVFQLLGYPERIAVLTSISHHLLTQVYGYSLGAFSLLLLLLPWFKKTALPEAAIRKNRDPWFWAKCLAALTGTAALAALIYTGKPSAATPADQKAGTGRPAAALISHSLPQSLNGRVVYQRPDGIYVFEIRDKKAQRIAPYGTYPRWSPDGRYIAFIHENRIMITPYGSGVPRELARAGKARALGFMPDGRSLLFTDGRKLRRVDIDDAKVTDVLTGSEFLEVDSAGNGRRIAATVRTLTGYKVRVYDIKAGTSRSVAKGCSASLSPDGSRITVNGLDHKNLFLHDWKNLQRVDRVSIPPGMKFDNQYWSNHPRYITATSETGGRNIFIHDLETGISHRVTATGDCDRSDFFVTSE